MGALLQRFVEKAGHGIQLDRTSRAVGEPEDGGSEAPVTHQGGEVGGDAPLKNGLGVAGKIGPIDRRRCEEALR